MKKNNKTKIKIGLLTLLFFLVSMLLMFNDEISYFMITATITGLLFIYLCVLVFRKVDDKSIYERELKKIMKTYDSILVYSDDKYKLGTEHVVFVNRIEDLIKTSEEINKPIVFIKEENSSVFLLNEESELLVYVKKVNNRVISDYELKIIEHMNDYKETGNKKLLDNIEKTTLIKLKNNKVYKVSPIRKNKSKKEE